MTLTVTSGGARDVANNANRLERVLGRLNVRIMDAMHEGWYTAEFMFSPELPIETRSKVADALREKGFVYTTVGNQLKIRW